MAWLALVVLLVPWPRLNPLPIEKLGALCTIIRSLRHLLLLSLLKSRAFLFVERKCLLEPSKGASLLLEGPARRVCRVHRAAAHHAHAHGRRNVSGRCREMMRTDCPRGVWSLLQRGIRVGLDGAEELPVRMGRWNHSWPNERRRKVGKRRVDGRH